MDLSINSRFFHFMSKIADCMILSVLWLLCSLPVITAGSASTALYYCIVKVIRKDEGSVWKDYWQSFRSNLKHSILFIGFLLIFSLIISAIGSLIYTHAPVQNMLTNIYSIYIIWLAFCVAWMHYLFSYIARFQAPVKTVLKNSLVICLVNLPVSLSLIFLFAAVIFFLLWTFPGSAMTLLLVPALYALVSSFLLERIYRKYLPPEEPVCDSES